MSHGENAGTAATATIAAQLAVWLTAAITMCIGVAHAGDTEGVAQAVSAARKAQREADFAEATAAKEMTTARQAANDALSESDPLKAAAMARSALEARQRADKAAALAHSLRATADSAIGIALHAQVSLGEPPTSGAPLPAVETSRASGRTVRIANAEEANAVMTEAAVFERNNLASLNNHPITSSSVSGPGLTVTGSTENGSVLLKVGPVDGPQVTFSAPTSKTDSTTKLATLDGLANAFSAKLNYQTVNATANPKYFNVLGVSGKVGAQQSTYFDPTTLAKKMVTNSPSSGSVFGGYGGATGDPKATAQWLLLARFEFQNSYDDAKSKVLCPAATSFPVTCVSGSIGEPSRGRKRISTLEYRRDLKAMPFFGDVGLAPAFSYESTGKVKGIDFPIYLIADDKKAMTGGIDVGWRSDTHGSFGVFVGIPFTVIPKLEILLQ